MPASGGRAATYRNGRHGEIYLFGSDYNNKVLHSVETPVQPPLLEFHAGSIFFIYHKGDAKVAGAM
jgi:hypothetical protein